MVGDGGGNRLWRTFAVTFSFGFMLAGGLALGFWVGAWADRRFGTDPWLTLLGLVLGVVAAFRAMLHQLRAGSADERDR